jgi:hypothetical protein
MNADDTSLTESDRSKLLSKIHSALFWVGRQIPEEEDVEGERVKLKDIVFRYIAKNNPSLQEMEGAYSLARRLQSKVDDMESQIKHADMTVREAEELLDHTLGLMRAIDELKKRGGPGSDVKLQALLCKVDDQKRWLDFVRSLM